MVKKTGPDQPSPDRRGAQKIGRNASSGQFTTVKEAQKKPATHVVETIKKAAPAPKSNRRK